MEKEKGIVVKLPWSLNMLLKQHQLDLEGLGIHKTKSELIITLTTLGLVQESKMLQEKISKS
jgi:hypothetical protein